MKLKKIASLALAGVMAVSMLAGCSGAPASSTTTPVVPTTSDDTAEVSAAVKSRLGVALPNYVTFTDSTALSEKLEYAVEYSGVLDTLDSYVLTATLTQPSSPNFYSVWDVLKDEADVTTSKLPTKDQHTIWNIGNEGVLVHDEKDAGDTIPNAVAVELFVISGAIGENAVNQQIADKIDQTVAAYKYSIGSGMLAGGGDFTHNYAVSVSTCTKTVNSVAAGSADGFIGAEDPVATFVAVQVVRTSTHQ